MISDEAIEAAAKAMYASQYADPFEELSDAEQKQEFLEMARAALEAVALRELLAAAWAEGHSVGRTDEWSLEPNPYRSDA